MCMCEVTVVVVLHTLIQAPLFVFKFVYTVPEELLIMVYTWK